MNIPVETIMTLAGLIVTIAIGWGKLVSSEARQQEEINKLWAELTKYRSWRDEHEKEANEKRIEFIQDMSKMREIIASKDGKLDEILGRLQKIETKIDKIETNKN